MKKILISTGGSGGHVIPALTVFEHLKDKFEVYLVSDKRGTKFIEKNLFKFKIIDVPNISITLLIINRSTIFVIFFIFIYMNQIKHFVSSNFCC